jgi:acyl-coenzyme A synthetase/AMP-(fatty) acid ligase
LKDNTARLVLASLMRAPGKPAIGDADVTLSRSSLMANVERQARAMREEGLKPGDFFLLLCDRGLTFWVELLAGWVIGAKPVCLESKIAPEHAASVLQLTGARFVSASSREIGDALAGLTHLTSTFDATLEVDELGEAFRRLPFAADSDMPDLAGLIFTSGTTGLPKGVPLTHRVLNMNALSTAQRLRMRDTDRLFIATPFRFISSISHFLVTLISGASFFGSEKPMMIKDLLGSLNALEISAFGGSPFHVQFLAMAGSARLPHLRWMMSSGDHLRPAVIDEIEKNFGNIELHVVYGMAELGGRFCELPPERKFKKKGSVGFPINGYEFAVLDEAGKPCGTGEIGEIHVSGLLGFEGYFGNEEASGKVLGPQGFKNGDKGYLDEDGCLYLAGRSDSVFKRSGLKVSAQVVTEAIMELDSVEDVFVAGEEDDIEGRVPVAYVCWKGSARHSVAEMCRMLSGKLPVNHMPKKLVTLPAIPRTGSGKVDRRRLASLLEEGADPVPASPGGADAQ